MISTCVRDAQKCCLDQALKAETHQNGIQLEIHTDVPFVANAWVSTLLWQTTRAGQRALWLFSP